MKRRTTDVSGWVNFPINDPAWPSSGEGGMLVKLVVCDSREMGDRLSLCCGAGVYDLLIETLAGDDRRPAPIPAVRFEDAESIKAHQEAYQKWKEYHFPHLNDEFMQGHEKYLSRPYLSVIVLGSTRWSGRKEGGGEPWHCHTEDLTQEGKALYQQIAALYPGCELHLLTLLDT